MSGPHISAVIVLGLLLLTLVIAPFTSSDSFIRHTPGFPDYSLSSLEELLSIIEQELRTALEPGPLSNGEIVLEALVSEVQDPSMRELLGEALQSYKQGGLSREDLQKYLDRLQELQQKSSSASINMTEDYVRAMEFFRLISEMSGYTDVAQEADKALLDALLSRLPETFQRTESSLIFGERVDTSWWNPRIGRLEPPPNPLLSSRFPSIQLPAISPPSINTSSILPVAGLIIAILITSCLLKAWKRAFHSIFSRMSWITERTPIFRAQGLEELQVVALYWRAVNFISRRYGAAITPVTTHREYLIQVENKLEQSRFESFSRLTGIYEVARFGGVRNSLLESQAHEEYNKVVSGI